MKNKILGSLFTFLILGVTHTANAAIEFGEGDIDGKLQGNDKAVDKVITDLIGTFLGFVGLIALAYMLW